MSWAKALTIVNILTCLTKYNIVERQTVLGMKNCTHQNDNQSSIQNIQFSNNMAIPLTLVTVLNLNL